MNRENRKEQVNLRKAAVIGCGFVGSATAFSLMQSGLFAEIGLSDADMDRAEGEALDISHGAVSYTHRDVYKRQGKNWLKR